MTERDEDQGLEAIFGAARARPVPHVRDDVMARIMAEAQAHLPPPVAPATPRTDGFWSGLFASVGGWAGLSGMAAATCAGVWLGFVQPDGLSGISSDLMGASLTLPSIEATDVFGLEG